MSLSKKSLDGPAFYKILAAVIIVACIKIHVYIWSSFNQTSDEIISMHVKIEYQDKMFYSYVCLCTGHPRI